jgi:6-phosphogluconate dehydrogenase
MATSESPQLGVVGLGRMGSNIARRLARAGHDVVVTNRSLDPIRQLEAEGVAGADDIESFVAKLRTPRAAWIMVPAGDVTDRMIERLAAAMEPGDTIIDGGNSYYRDDIRHAEQLRAKGIHFVDIGTSGGVWGLERGFCLMIGGEDDVVERLRPIFETLAPGLPATSRTPGRSGDPAPSEQGWLHCGPTGAGHFVKMVHNGIEYGVMAAYAEGLAILRGANAGATQRTGDAETAPLDHPEFYRYEFDLPEVAEVWRRGSVIGSWLLDLTAIALRESPTLDSFGGRVSDSGEGRWTSIAAVEEGVPSYVLTAALYERFSSRNEGDYANRLLSAMRKQFGGHAEKTS